MCASIHGRVAVLHSEQSPGVQAGVGRVGTSQAVGWALFKGVDIFWGVLGWHPLKRLGASTRYGLQRWWEEAAPRLAPSLGMAGQPLESPPGPRAVEKACEGREAREAVQRQLTLLGSL